LQVALGIDERDSRLFGSGPSAVEGGGGVAQFFLGAFDAGPLDVHVGARDIQLGLGLTHLGFEGLRVDARNDLAGLDLGVEVRQEFRI